VGSALAPGQPRVADLALPLSPALPGAAVGPAGAGQPARHPRGALADRQQTVVADLVLHQEPTLGYRIEEGGRSLTYIPDHEPGLGLDLATIGKDWISGFRLAAEADILVHSAHYSEAEYVDHKGWGHSSIAQVVTLARRCAVRRLVLFHHDPFHTDSDLEVLQAEAKVLWGATGAARNWHSREWSWTRPRALPSLRRRSC
jgi:hypothetical protein